MAKGFFHLASFSQQLLQDRDDKVFLVETFAFLLGLSSGVLLSQDELADLEERIALLTEHRAKGGRATKRLTPEQEDIAKEYVRDELKPRVSITAACNRAAPKLLKEHGINVSGKTLMRLFPPQCRDSA